MDSIIDGIMAISPGVRYVAVCRAGRLSSRQRPGLAGASASESDRYEELIVNPVLLELVKRRGDIDCGGARWLVIGYGHFFQLVCAVDGGHVSVAFELDQDPMRHMPDVLRVLAAHGLA
ncbi:MAG TPA: hypothetical protein VFF02_10085 [Anaeromyxobacteraceae bacterium]|nr:hypothetical protein [Anaeromyxobacteraceae bacterium]